MPEPAEIPPQPLEMADHISAPPPPSHLTKTLPVASAAWVLYDTANTVYAAVVTFIFAPYVGELFGSRSILGITNSVSMICSGLCMQVFASLADQTGRARLYLFITTLGCIGGMAVFGLTSVPFLVMAAFFLANFAYNAALVYYNSLLPSVAADKHQGLVSGLGVGLGYIGTIIIVVLLDLPQAVGYPATFGIAAAIFLALALPCFLLVRERRVQSRTPFFRRQFVEMIKTLKGLPKDRAVMWFLIGNFFCVDVLNTAILYFGDFTRGTFFVSSGTGSDAVWTPREGASLALFGTTIDSPSSLLTLAGLSLNLLALVFGITLGFMTDKWGSLRVLRLSAAFLALGLVGAAIGGGNNLLLYMIGICGFGALGLAGIWTAGRKLLIELCPRERLGEYFGLYGITTKLSVLGSAVFGLVFDTVSRSTGDDLYGWKTAMCLQAVPLLVGLGFLALVKKRPATAS
jgi:MFS transporter, UMF1 family